MNSVPWFVLVGAVLVLVGLAARWIDRLPLSPALAYLLAGIAIGPAGLGLLHIDFVAQAHTLEVLAEVAVLLSLFGVGLRLQLEPRSPAWRVPLLLAGPGMLITTVLAAGVAQGVLGLPLAAALLLGAVLAPTDPVLASDVQLRHSGDRDAVRVAITAEGGLNDGTAFPAVLLALGLYGAHELGSGGMRWLLLDVAWALTSAVALGWLCGWGMGRLLALLRRSGSGPQSEEFVVLGVIASTYGVALLCGSYGFVAVFVAAVALAHAERRDIQREAPATPAAQVDVSHSQQLLRFAGQCERLMEVAVVLVIGAALAQVQWRWPLLAFAAVMLFVVRPLAVRLALPKAPLKPAQRRLVAWFGIRGVGSVYYLAFALAHGAPGPQLGLVIDATLVTLAASMLVHGISATPLMTRHRGRDVQS